MGFFKVLCLGATRNNSRRRFHQKVSKASLCLYSLRLKINRAAGLAAIFEQMFELKFSNDLNVFDDEVYILELKYSALNGGESCSLC